MILSYYRILNRINSVTKFNSKNISLSSKNNNESTRIELYNPSKVTRIKTSNKIKLNLNPALVNDTCQRPLTLLFTWMSAKDKPIEKYRQLWFRRGFDVLTVHTSPKDLLLPPIGARLKATNLVKCLSQLSEEYNEIVVQAFSVGGYQFGETLLQLREDQYNHILQSIKGVIFDSLAFHDNLCLELSRYITLNPIVQPMIEKSINAYLKLFHNISVKNYEKASEMIFNPMVKYPGLFLFSKDDDFSNARTNERFCDNWRRLGNRVTPVCWDQSTHVLHYRHHQQEYEKHLDKFIKSLNLRNNKN